MTASLTLEQSLATLRHAFDGAREPRLREAMAVATEAHEVDSLALARAVFSWHVTQPLLFQAIVRTGAVPTDGYMGVDEGLALMDALKECGADARATYEVAGRAYTPLELLVASLPRKVRGEDLAPVARWLAEAGARVEPAFERTYGANESLPAFAQSQGQPALGAYLVERRAYRPSVRKPR